VNDQGLDAFEDSVDLCNPSLQAVNRTVGVFWPEDQGGQVDR